MLVRHIMTVMLLQLLPRMDHKPTCLPLYPSYYRFALKLRHYLDSSPLIDAKSRH